MSLKILIVDDRPEDRKTIAGMLRQEEAFAKYALRMLEAGDGEEGLAVFQREQPDLVIADLLMPKTDGFWLCHHIRELPDGKAVPLLVVSGVYKDLAVAKRLRDNFDAELLAKPIQSRRFVAKALELLGRVAQVDPAESASWRTQTAAHALVPVAPAAASPSQEIEPIDLGAPLPPDQAAAPASAVPLRATPAAIDFTHPQRGMLNRNPLGWLLVHAATAAATGTFKLSRGKVRKIVFMIDGQPIYVDSNLRNETLGAFLISRGVLNEEQLAKAMKQARASGKKLGETLSALGLVDERTVAEGLTGQVRLKLAGALRWPDGAFSWMPGDDFSARVPSSPVDGVELALAALKKLTPVEEVSAELQPFFDQALALASVGDRLRPRIEAVFGASVLRDLLSGASLRQVAEAHDVPSLLVQVQVLRLTGLVAFVAPSQRRQTPMGSHRPVLGGAAEPAAEVIDLSGAAESGLELRDLDPTIPRTTSAVIELADIELVEPGGDEPPLHAQPEDSGILLVPAVDDLELETPEGQSAHRAQAAAARAAEVPDVEPIPVAPIPLPLERPATDHLVDPELKALVKRTYEGIHERSFYEILELPRDAAADAIESAYRRVLDRFSPGTLSATPSLDLELSDQLGELNAIVEQAYSILSDPIRRETYDETLSQAEAQPEPSRPDAFSAELCYQEGQTLLRDKAFPEAVLAFERAVRANPDQPTYHAYLGWALFLARGRGEAGAMSARPHLDDALRIAPDSAQVHELAGHVERDARCWRAAADHLIRALAAGSPRLDLFELVKDTLLRLELHDELERQYRQLIFRLREREPLKTVPLWLELAYLYLHRLDQPENAKVAIQVAAKLAPSDPRVKAAWAVAVQAEPRAPAAAPAGAAGAVPSDDRWVELAEGHRQRFLADLSSSEPLHALAALHREGGRRDRALAVLGMLAHRSEGTLDELKLLDELEAGGRRAPKRALSAAELSFLRRDEENLTQLELIACISPLLAQELPVTLESLGSSEIELLAAIALPSPFREVLESACCTLGLPPPPTYLSQTLGEDARPLPGDELALVVGQALVDGKDEARIAFLVARALSCLDPGRRHLFSRPVAGLKDPVLATLGFFRPSVRAADPEGKIARLKQAVEGVASPRLAELVGQLVAQKQLNLSEWRRSVRRGSARIGLLCGGDLRIALGLVQDEPEVRDGLQRFALEERYYELRRVLKIAAT
jgi:CheY-like chemotaxis protein/tetratricopeptide (TPR) repeat protein